MAPQPDILLLNAAIHTDSKFPHQIAAWNLLQSKLPQDVLLKFQTLFRSPCVNGEEGDRALLSVADGSADPDIRLVNAATYHDGLAHQEEAWLYLQEAVSSDALLAFQDAFRSGPPPVSQPKITSPLTAAPAYTGRLIALPGRAGTVFTDQPIIPGGSFSWGEATHGGVRVPLNRDDVENIVELATLLERARRQIGKPFRVTSWYRPEPWNTRAGGVRNSQHLRGKGIDVVVDGYDGRSLGRALDWWPGGRGIYPGNRRHILHLDIGAKRVWGF